MLWFLHLSADAGIVVTAYRDEATGSMVETEDGSGHFTEVTLRPVAKVAAEANTELALKLHEKAHRLCFIASSVNFPVLCQPSVITGRK
jgi:organic hydroperoxide reductase OsmC/OhrA